jgi:hypothetical protein
MRKNAGNTRDGGDGGPPRRGRPFAKGNPGRPKGSRNKATLIAESLLDGQAENITTSLLSAAFSGDVPAIRLCMERLLPPRRERTVQFDLPPLENPEDAVAAAEAVLRAVADGELTPGEAMQMHRLIESFAKIASFPELERRMAALERRYSPEDRL